MNLYPFLSDKIVAKMIKQWAHAISWTNISFSRTIAPSLEPLEEKHFPLLWPIAEKSIVAIYTADIKQKMISGCYFDKALQERKESGFLPFRHLWQTKITAMRLYTIRQYITSW